MKREETADEIITRIKRERQQAQSENKANGQTGAGLRPRDAIDDAIEDALVAARNKLSGIDKEKLDKVLGALAKKENPIDYALEKKVVADKLGKFGIGSKAIDDAVKIIRDDREVIPLNDDGHLD